MNHNRAETAHKFLALLNTQELAALGPAVRASRWPLAGLNAHLEKLCREANLPSENQKLIRSVVLLWHDYLDESHTISQGISTPDGSVLHGIMHRREPDYANAKYWFARAGTHNAFAEIGRQVQTLLQNTETAKLRTQLIRNEAWCPDGFVDVCREFGGEPLSKEYRSLQEVQQIETNVLLQNFCTTPR